MPLITERQKAIQSQIHELYGDKVSASVSFLIAEVMAKQEEIVATLQTIAPELTNDDIRTNLSQLQSRLGEFPSSPQESLPGN